MRFDLLQSISLNGDPAKPNDDRAGATADLAWVIDGATDLGPPGLLGAQGGAAWLAQTAHEGLAATQAANMADTCAHAFGAIAARFEAERTRDVRAPWELPKAAFAAAQIVDDQLQVAWVADCSVMVVSDGCARWVTPAPDTADEAADAQAVGAGKEITGAILDDRRAARARPDHAALSPDPQRCAAVTQQTSLPVVPGDEVLLMSDGVTSLVADYRVYTAQSLAEAAASRGLAALVQEIRQIEASDPDCTQYPRFKRSDDATALWLRVC